MVLSCAAWSLGGVLLAAAAGGVVWWVRDRRDEAAAWRLRAQIERAHASHQYAPLVPLDVEAADFEAWERELTA